MAANDEQARKNYDYFMAHLSELYSKYKGKFLVLKDEQVVSAHDSLEQAYAAAIASYKPGEFSIQECKSDRRESYVQVFHSACVRFA